MDKLYDVCIVGAGMIGSAAARHSSAHPHLNVCLVGPVEPKNKKELNVRCYGSYYDEARLTRYMCAIPEWVKLSEKAIPKYRELERRTGIHFYQEAGCLIVDEKGGQFIQDNIKSIEGLYIPVLQPSLENARKMFPYMSLSDKDAIAIETVGAGYINPRKMVRAEQTAAHLQGCDVIVDVVKRIVKATALDGERIFEVVGESSGRKIRTKKVILATGAFTDFYELLPKNTKPDWDLVTHTVILAELGPEEVERMRGMPPMVYNGEACRRASGSVPYDGWGMYLLPPVQYPDGRTYLKLGHHHMPNMHSVVTSHQEMVDWFRGNGSQDAIEWLTKVLYKLFPGIRPLSVHSDTCVLVHTATVRPYVSMIEPNFAVALGGNGMAAKSCDQIGKLVADLVVHGTWQSEIPQEAFAFKKAKL